MAGASLLTSLEKVAVLPQISWLVEKKGEESGEQGNV